MINGFRVENGVIELTLPYEDYKVILNFAHQNKKECTELLLEEAEGIMNHVSNRESKHTTFHGWEIKRKFKVAC